jgi:hypothetical protein
MAIKIFAVMLLPINFLIEFGSPGFFQYTSIILTLGSYPYFDSFLPTQGFYPFFPDPITIVLAIVVCLPGLYFSRWIEQQPRETPVKKMALAAAVFTSLITFPLAMFVPYNPFMPIFGGIMMVQSAVPWVIAVFVVLPVMSRHGSYIDSDRKAAHFSDTPEISIHEGGIRPGRYTILGYLLGIIALCIPNFGYIYGGFSPGFSSLTIGMVTPVWTGTYSQYGMGAGSFSLYIMPSFTVFMSYLLCIFSIIFAYSILQYIQTHIDRMRVLAYGALSIVVPYAFFSISSPFMTVIPFPVLLVLGLPIAFLVKQVPARQTIWEDKAVQMWYEKGQEITIMSNQPSGKQIMRPDAIATVKVPFTYLLISKLRSLRFPNMKSVPENKSDAETEPHKIETDPHKADWAESDDLWATDEGE